MFKNKNIFTIIAFVLMFLIVIQTTAHAFVFTAAFLGAATFLATNAAVIIPACTCVVAMAGAAIAIVDVVRRMGGHEPSAMTKGMASSIMSGSAQGLIKGVTGVGSMAKLTSGKISSGSYATAASMLKDASSTASNAAKVAVAMSSQIDNTRSTLQTTNLTRQGLDHVIQLSDVDTSHTAALAAGMKAADAQASSLMLKALLKARQKWMKATKTVKQVTMTLKKDVDLGVAAVSEDLSKKMKSAMDAMSSVSDAIKNTLAKIKGHLDDITTNFGKNLKEWIARKVVPKHILDRIRREQEAKLKEYGVRVRSNNTSQSTSFYVPKEDVQTQVRTNMDAGTGSGTGLKAFRDYKAAYKDYISIMRSNPDSKEAAAAKVKYKELYEKVTGGQSNGSAAPISPAILNNID